MTIKKIPAGSNGVAATAPSALVWLRRDLRCHDHAALYHALRRHERVYCAFVFDTDILDALPTRCDRRVEFIHASVLELHDGLQQLAARSGAPGGGLIVRHGPSLTCIVQLAQALGVQEVLANRDYEPQALERDQRVAQALGELGIAFSDYKDQVLLERDELLTQQGRPYSVFTPYKRAWLQRLDAFQLKPYPVERYARHLAPPPAGERLPTLADLGFTPTNLHALPLPTGMRGAQQLLHDFAPRMAAYHEARDYPGRKGVSYLSVHLRFGTVSIRQLAALAAQQASEGSAGAQTWLSELAWRDFYFMILWHHPQVVTQSFKPEYDRVQWDEAPELWQAWCEALTGYPLVDAAMRQILQTGYMHNRLLFCPAPERLRPGRQQRRLAVGRVYRLRRAALLPHLQPHHAVRTLRSGRAVHPPLPARTGPSAGCAHPLSRRHEAGRTRGLRSAAGGGLPAACRRSRQGTRAHTDAFFAYFIK